MKHDQIDPVHANFQGKSDLAILLRERIRTVDARHPEQSVRERERKKVELGRVLKTLGPIADDDDGYEGAF